MDDLTHLDTKTFIDTLDGLDLRNHVNFPTHKLNHYLDLFIDSISSPILTEVECGFMLLDHNFVHALIKLTKPRAPKQEVTYRKPKNIDHSKIDQDLSDIVQQSTHLHNPSPEELVSFYNGKLMKVLNQHAPPKTKLLTISHLQPWFDEKIKAEIILRRHKEQAFRQNPTEYNYRASYHKRRHVTNIIKSAKKQHYINVIQENKDSIKNLYSITNKLFFWKEPLPLPEIENPEKLATSFSEFFDEKIRKIMHVLAPENPSNINTIYIEKEPLTHRIMISFSEIEESTMRCIIQKSATKSCQLDPLPTIFIKQHLTVLLSLITRAVNVSNTTGKFPDNLKEAILQPLLKKHGLDHIPQKYRPVSNLPYLGTLIESCVSNQLVHHTKSTGNVEPFQSAYRANHSTETALLKVKDDLLDAMDGEEVVCLILLDLSAAFDTVSHNILLNCLHHQFGITDTALAWVRDYLSNRTQRVSVEVSGKKAESHKVLLKQGVPQGSILGPLLFMLYILSMGDICCQHNINVHGYADDTQNYLSFRPDKHITNKIRCKENLERCISEVCTWMHTNLLKLNDNKTEFFSNWDQKYAQPVWIHVHQSRK